MEMNSPGCNRGQMGQHTTGAWRYAEARSCWKLVWGDSGKVGCVRSRSCTSQTCSCALQYSRLLCYSPTRVPTLPEGAPQS